MDRDRGAEASAVPVPPWRTPPKAVNVRQPLSQERIVQTGLQLLDAEGLDGVSMRRVAQELGTGPASLYAHVSGKEELLDLIFDRVLGEVELPDEPDPQRWIEQVRQIAVSAHRVMCAHADIARVALANVPVGPNALRIAEKQLQIMRAGGVPAQVAAWMIDRLSLYIVADAYEGSLLRVRSREGGEQALAEYFGRIEAYYRSLPPDRFPAFTAHVEELMSGKDEERFEFGLDILLAGLARFGRADGAKSSPG